MFGCWSLKPPGGNKIFPLSPSLPFFRLSFLFSTYTYCTIGTVVISEYFWRVEVRVAANLGRGFSLPDLFKIASQRGETESVGEVKLWELGCDGGGGRPSSFLPSSLPPIAAGGTIVPEKRRRMWQTLVCVCVCVRVCRHCPV